MKRLESEIIRCKSEVDNADWRIRDLQASVIELQDKTIESLVETRMKKDLIASVRSNRNNNMNFLREYERDLKMLKETPDGQETRSGK